MTGQLTARLEELRTEIAASSGETRKALLEKLEQVVLGLEGVGADVPAWAREMAEASHDEDVEDGFDNMPV